MFGSEAPPANDSPPSPAKNLAAMCLMSCAPLPLPGLPPTPTNAPSSAVSFASPSNTASPHTSAFFPLPPLPSSMSSATTPSMNPQAIHHQEFHKRYLPNQASSFTSAHNGAKQQRSSSPPRLASIRSPHAAATWRKPPSLSHSSILSNPAPLFPPSSSSSSGNDAGASTPFSLPDLITPPHPSNEKSSAAENMVTSSASVLPVLSDEALQATASKCAVTSIMFSPPPNPNLAGNTIPAFNKFLLQPPPPPPPPPPSYLLPSEEEEEENEVEEIPARPAAIPLPNAQQHQQQHQTPYAPLPSTSSSSVSAKRPAEVIVLDDDEALPLPLVPPPQKRSTISSIPLREHFLLFISFFVSFFSLGKPVVSSQQPMTGVLAPPPLPQRPLPHHLQAQLLLRQQQIRASGIARTAPSTSPSSFSSIMPPQAHQQTNSTPAPNSVIEVIDSDEEEKAVQIKASTSSVPPEW